MERRTQPHGVFRTAWAVQSKVNPRQCGFSCHSVQIDAYFLYFLLLAPRTLLKFKGNFVISNLQFAPPHSLEHRLFYVKFTVSDKVFYAKKNTKTKYIFASLSIFLLFLPIKILFIMYDRIFLNIMVSL